ncbi:MAG: hypothetical protein ACFFFC_00045 [Candidatus Thorarchaeota archaeon]
MKFRDYPLKKEGMLIPGNVEITVRERGKKVKEHCRHSHNIWVNLGREYLARVIAPNNTYTDHYIETGPSDREFIRYMGLGCGGDSQWHYAAYTSPIKDDYPPGIAQGSTGNMYSDDDLTVQTLERPIAISMSGGNLVWLGSVSTPVDFLDSGKTLRVKRLFTEPECNSDGGIGPYTIVPLSEVALFLQTADPEASDVYDSGNPPTMIGTGRQQVMGYNTFETIPKTTSFSLEVRWELRF